MFGGLDVKGTSSSKPAAAAENGSDGNKSDAAAEAPAPSASSAFSFLTAPVTEAPASAFSFMGGGGAASEAKPEAAEKEPEKEEAVSAATSAFSFLSQPTPSTDDGDKKETPAPAPAADAPSSPNSGSMFSFLSATTSPTAAAPSPSSPGAAAPAAPAAGSGFSFMSSSEPPTSSSGDAAAALSSSMSSLPPLVPGSPGAKPPSFPINSTTTEAKPPASSASDILSMSNPNQPVGTGVVFGGARPPTKKPIKKRTRSHKIGAAAAAAAPAMPAPMTMGSTSAASSISSMTPTPGAAMPTTASTIPPASPTVSTTKTPPSPPSPPTYSSSFVPPTVTEVDRDDAAQASLEAVRRAEAFMQEKMAAAAVAHSSFETPPTPPTYGNSNSHQQQPTTTSPTDDTDYAAAKAAAEEAKAQMAKSGNKLHHPGAGPGLARLFGRGKGVVAGWAHRDRSSHGFAANSNQSSVHSHRSMSPATTTSAESESAAERIRREQEEIKRAMAERSLAMQPQQQPTQETEGEPVTEAAGTGAFVPPPAPAGAAVAARSPSPPPPPPPPKIRTPEELLDEMVAAFRQGAKVAMDRVADLRRQRAELLEERTQAETKERLATQQIVQAQSQQAAAVEIEAFDLCEKLQQFIDAHTREQEEQQRILKNITGALTQIDEQRDNVVGAVAGCFADAKRHLMMFRRDQENSERKGDSKAMERFSATSKLLSTENERLLADLKHIERDEGLVAEERAELDSAIGEHTAGVEKERVDACQKLQIVKDEIEELRERLAAREAVANQLKTEITYHDVAIDKVKVSFARQIGRVQKKEAAVKENRNEWLAEKSKYEHDKEAHDEEVKAHSEALLTHDELMKRLLAEIELSETLEKVVEEEVAFDSAGGSKEGDEGDDSELAQMQMKVVEGEAAVAEATEVLKVAEGELKSLDEEHKALIARIPELEAEKKKAAASRDFRGAGKASKEIKDATSRLKACEEELEAEALQNVKKAKEELKRLEQDLEAKYVVMHHKEKEEGEAAMVELVKKIRRLIATKKRVCGDAAANSVKAVGVLVLNGQISALKKEGEALGDKFGGWEESIGEISEEEANDMPKETEEDDDKTAKKLEEKAKETEQAKTKSSAAKQEDGEKERGELNKDKIFKFRDLTQSLKEAEELLEAAVEQEDYEEAAELDMVFQKIRTDLEALSLTDAEMEIALTEGGDSIGEKSEAAADEQQETEQSGEKETDDEKDVNEDEQETEEAGEREAHQQAVNEEAVNSAEDDADDAPDDKESNAEADEEEQQKIEVDGEDEINEKDIDEGVATSAEDDAEEANAEADEEEEQNEEVDGQGETSETGIDEEVAKSAETDAEDQKETEEPGEKEASQNGIVETEKSAAPKAEEAQGDDSFDC